MKNPKIRVLYLLAVFALVLITPLFLVFGAAVPPEKRSELVFVGLFLAIAAGFLTLTIADVLQKEIPNGKPRPEDELNRGIPCFVHIVVPLGLDTLCVLANYAGTGKPTKPTIWEFAHRDAVTSLKPGSCFVYLDDPDQYLKKWHDEGVIMILSAEGRAKANKSSDLSPHMKAHLERVAEVARNLS